MSNEVLIDQYPDCDLCLGRGATTEAHYDAATVFGAWGYLCEEDFKRYGVGLGTGKGQRLVLRSQR